MSSPLDRIEADIRGHTAAKSLGEWRVVVSRDDVLALVNVAKAAEGVMTQMDYETPHHTRLREALDALDKEPA